MCGACLFQHCDNPHRNGRKLTVLYYLNNGWQPEDGGELRVYDAANTVVRDVEPILDRVVLFFSDQRVPHEVLPAHKERFAVTLWFYDNREKRKAEQDALDVGATGLQGDLLIEQRRIEKEIAKFEQQERAKATVEVPSFDTVPPSSDISPLAPEEEETDAVPSPLQPADAVPSLAPTVPEAEVAATHTERGDDDSKQVADSPQACGNSDPTLQPTPPGSSESLSTDTTPPAVAGTPSPNATHTVDASVRAENGTESLPVGPSSSSAPMAEDAPSTLPPPVADTTSTRHGVEQRAQLPEYTVVRQTDTSAEGVETGECLVFKVALPGVVRGGRVVLDVTPTQLHLSHSDPDYELSVALNATTDPARVRAKFKKATSTMKATLPIVAP